MCTPSLFITQTGDCSSLVGTHSIRHEGEMKTPKLWLVLALPILKWKIASYVQLSIQCLECYYSSFQFCQGRLSLNWMQYLQSYLDLFFGLHRPDLSNLQLVDSIQIMCLTEIVKIKYKHVCLFVFLRIYLISFIKKVIPVVISSVFPSVNATNRICEILYLTFHSVNASIQEN